MGLPLLPRAGRVAAWLTLAALSSTSARADDESAPAPTSASGSPPAEAAPLETRVRARRERRLERGDRRSDLDPALASATPEDALEALAGVSLVRDGGPLAPSRVLLRGLAGPRVQADVGGLVVGDPTTGEIDAALLPLFAAASILERPGSGRSALGGRVSVASLEGWVPTLRARVGVGTLATLRADLVVGAPTPDGGHVTFGAQVGTTRGDFQYIPLTRSGVARSAPVRRANNDQRRANALFSARSHAGPATLEVLAWAAAHEGGIPGFATAPSEGLRGERLVAGGHGGLRLDLGDARVTLRAHALATSRHVRGPSRGIDDRLSSATEGLEGELRLSGLGGWIDLAATARAARVDLLEGGFSRTTAALRAQATARLLDGWLLLDGALGAEGHDDVGLWPEGHLALELGRARRWAVGALASRGGRAPSLDELHAPRGLVLGNPDLAPEQATDAEVYARLRAPSLLDVRLAAFAGRLDDAILFLNRSAFEIRPVNTGPVLRAGLEGRVRVSPHELVALELTAAALASRMEVTGAPLPTVPPLHARLATRFGEERGHHLVVIMRHRARTPTTLFGTLAVPAYTLFDAVARWPLGDHLAATLSLTNLLDVQTAQDANLLPLPGRQVFCTLEVTHD